MTELPAHLKDRLAHLRADEHFQQVMALVPRTRLVPFSPTKDREKAATELIYLSGKIAGERAIMLWIMGYDTDDRQSE